MRAVGAVSAVCAILVLAVIAPAAAQEPTLRQTERRIWHDEGALERLGMYLSWIDLNPERDRVIVHMITRRGDAGEIMRERYGQKVRVRVDADRRSQLVRTRWDQYTPSPSGRAVRIWWGTNSVFRLDRVRVREGRRRVVITVIERAPNGIVTLALRYQNKLVRLHRPLGNRVVIDGATGKRRPVGDGISPGNQKR